MSETLGYKNFSEYTLANLCAKSPDIVDKFCRKITTEKNPELGALSNVQFGRMFKPIRKRGAEDECQVENKFEDDDSDR